MVVLGLKPTFSKVGGTAALSAEQSLVPMAANGGFEPGTDVQIASPLLGWQLAG